MAFQDKTLTCSDCSASFTFSAEDQEFYKSKGYANEPKRCPDCRQKRKTERTGSTGGGGGSYGAPRQMFPATCAQCGKTTEVPFQPRGDKPVYCSDCYRKTRPSR
jgi:CxxC-x17-CxxC domain-containing protein